MATIDQTAVLAINALPGTGNALQSSVDPRGSVGVVSKNGAGNISSLVQNGAPELIL